MCGIWASIGWTEGDTHANALAGLNAANTRGPDGQQLDIIDTPCGPLFLGHRRLAVYDLQPRAAQPMQRGPLTAVFNGALYDFKEVRATLSAAGASFQTDGDTEVLLEAWLRWGPDCLTRFDGMFAIILYDARTHTLHLARDRFGEKPLHIIKSDRGFAAASEINQFRAADMLRNARANIDVVCDFLDLGQAEAGRHTFFAGVDRVLPGHHLVWDLSGSKPKAMVSHLLFPSRKSIDKSLSDPKNAAQALRAALDVSVARRMVADVKVGSCLSGGLDSTAIVRIAARGGLNSDGLECICAVFDEEDPSGLNLSERQFAKAAADQSGINLHFITPTSQDLTQTMSDVVARQGEPFAHTSIAVQHFVFKAAKELGIVVMLDGQGADELFGGYSGMLGARLADVLLREGLSSWRDAIAAFAADGADLDAATLKRATLNALLPEALRRNLARARGRWPRPDQLTIRDMSFEPERIAGLSRFESLIANLTTTRSLPSLLRYEDRNAMSFGIETRLPFLSREVADLGEQIPGHVKARAGWTKAVLRDGVQDVVPELITRRRRKLGFVSPHDRWMAGPLAPWARAGVEAAKERFGPALSTRGVASALAGLGTDQSANAACFRLASLGHWAETNHVAL